MATSTGLVYRIHLESSPPQITASTSPAPTSAAASRPASPGATPSAPRPGRPAASAGGRAVVRRPTGMSPAAGSGGTPPASRPPVPTGAPCPLNPAESQVIADPQLPPLCHQRRRRTEGVFLVRLLFQRNHPGVGHPGSAAGRPPVRLQVAQLNIARHIPDLNRGQCRQRGPRLPPARQLAAQAPSVAEPVREPVPATCAGPFHSRAR